MSSKAAASALAWWREAGVDTLVAETPHDWLTPGRDPPRAETAPAPPPAPAPVQAMPDDLAAFREWLLTGDAFPPGGRVGPSGDPASGLMMMIDMPGIEDEAAGRLLAGEVGAMFDRMLQRIGRSRDTIYLASIMPVRAPTGRLAEAGRARLAEIARHHVSLVRPTALLLFGDEASKALLGMPMMAARGRAHRFDTPAGGVNAFATMSLRFLLDQPRRRTDAMADLELLMEELKP